jgi:hypothetical protein
MQRERVDSSAMVSVGFDAQTNTLEIEFPSGEVCCYFVVPQSVYKQLVAAESLGTYFMHAIRDRYRCERR